LIGVLYHHNRNPFVDHPEWVLTVSSPKLIISQEGNDIRLEWPPHYPDAILEWSLTLSNWLTVSNDTTLHVHTMSGRLVSLKFGPHGETAQV